MLFAVTEVSSIVSGSGFKKIFDFYRREVNFRSELHPTFYSNASTFIVRLFNLNYKQVGIDFGINNNLLVLDTIKANKYITITEIATTTKIPLRTVGRIIKDLKVKNKIARHGTKNGYWEILES
ncbi:MAG: hypothetical protein MJ052_01875 [Sphaerochaetaceae bacterium]|nr:hypothetical protein [Sphaerochaetaceae bacterium]